MICGTCGTTNEPGANFCIQCGTRLVVACPACGHGNLPSARFCASCGSAMPEPEAAGGAVPVIVYANLARLLWGSLASDRQPEAAAAADEAERFFAERGAQGFVRQFRQSFVRGGPPSATPGKVDASAAGRAGATVEG